RAGEDESGLRGRRIAGEAEYEGRRGRAADEGDPAGGPDRQSDAEGRDHSDGEIGAAGDRERVRRGQGVAGQGLEQGTGHTQGDADEDARTHPRQAGTEQDVTDARARL